MISRWVRTWHTAVLRPLLELLARLGITANMLTVASLCVAIFAGVLFAFGQTVVGAWTILLAGFFDSLDGELSRVTDTASPFGGFLDSICDHCGDFAIYLGLLLSSLPNHDFAAILPIFIASFASVFGSHVRSRAGMVGIDTKTIGIFTRAERNLVLIIGILIGKTTIALWVLAFFNSFSAVQRIIYAIRASRRNDRVSI